MSVDEPSAPAHRVRALIAVPDFRRLLAVRLTGQAGDGLFQGAMFGATFFNPERSTSAAEAAVAFSILLLPYSLVGPFAGVLLDRWSRQRVLVVANGLRAGLLLCLVASLATIGPAQPITIALALLAVSVNRFVLSGLSAGLPHVVPTSRLVTANAFTTTLGTAAAATGGLASLGLRALYGRDSTGASRIALAACVVYVTAALLARRMARDTLGPDRAVLERARTWRVVGRDLVEGAQHLRSRRPAAQALVAVATYRFFSGLLFVSVLLLYTADGYLGRGLNGLGQTLTAAVVGGLLAALVTPRITRRMGTQRWIVVALLLAATVTVTLLPLYRQPTMLLAGLGLGFAGQASKICVDTLLQESVDDEHRGRVFSVYDMLFNLSFVSAAVVAALVVPDDGRSLLVLGAVGAGLTLTALRYRQVVRRSVPQPTIAAGRS